MRSSIIPVLLLVFVDNAARCALFVVYGWEALKIGGSSLAVTCLFVGMHIVGALFASVLGRWADQLGAWRGLVLSETAASIFLIFYVLAESVLQQGLWLAALMVCAALTSATGYVSAPALQGLLQASCAEGGAMRAASRNASASAGGFIIGAMAAGQFINFGGSRFSLLASASCFALVAALCRRQQNSPRKIFSSEKMQMPVAEITKDVLSSGIFRNAAYAIAIAYTAFNMLGTILPAYAQEALRTDAAGLGMLRSIWSAGAVAAGVLFAVIPFIQNLRFVCFLMAATGIGFLVLSQASHFVLALVVMFLTGGLWASVRASLDAIVISSVPPRLIGRFRNRAMARASVWTLGAFGFSALLSIPSARVPPAGVGVFLLVGAAFVYWPSGGFRKSFT